MRQPEIYCLVKWLVMTKILSRISLFFALLLSFNLAFADELTPVPKLTSPVMDTAQMLSLTTQQELESHLLQYSQQKGSQIVVLTVPKVAPETPFDYAMRVAEQWQIGRAGYDDGVLLLLVRDERKTFLAVGRGLEGAIPDVYAKRILEDVLRPRMQAGQVDQAIVASVDQIEKLIAGEMLPEKQALDADGPDVVGSLFFLMVASIVFGNLFRHLLGDKLGTLAIAGLLFFFALTVFALGWGLSALASGLGVLVSKMAASGAFVSDDLSDHSGRWRDGGGFGGDRFGGGGGFGGGGFGGGGGGFGGGGASGGW